MSDFSNSTLGVTGASGHLGQAVLGYLKQRGAKKIVAITRDPAKLSEVSGIEIRKGDFNDPGSLASAFAGIERLLIISTDTIGGRASQQIGAIDAAERAGVKHILYTSITAPYPHPKHMVADDHFWTEARLSQFKGDWTALRDNLYADLVVWDAERTLASGQIFHASGDGKRATVTRDDIAATAAGALLTATGKEVVNVTGPEALSIAEVAATLSRVTGKPVAAVPVPAEGLLQGMIGAGLPPPLAEAYLGFDLATANGSLSVVTDAVRRFAGREPQTLEAFLRANLKAVAA